MSPVSVSSIGSFVREQHEQAKISIRQLAQIAGVSNPYLGQIERGLRKPSAELLQQIAKGLRISAEALYVQSGIREDRPYVSVASVVLADPDLTERQKQMLVELYDSFRKDAALAAGAADAAGSAEPTDLAEATEPADLAEATEPADIAEATEPADLAEATEPAEMAAGAEAAEMAEAAGMTDITEPAGAAEPAASSEHSPVAEPAGETMPEHMVPSTAASR
jgi:transcriptional regulator with XRE-family HTH domain